MVLSEIINQLNKKTMESLNPYCYGWYSLRACEEYDEFYVDSLNPYCYGWYSLSEDDPEVFAVTNWS